MTIHRFTSGCIQPYHTYHEYHDFDIFSQCEKFRAVFTLDNSTGKWTEPYFIDPDKDEELTPDKVPEAFRDKTRQFREACMTRYKP